MSHASQSSRWTSCCAALSSRIQNLRVAAMFASSNAVVLLRLHFRLLRYHAPALSRVFHAVERGHVRRVSIEIRTRDPKLLLMRIDPLPQLLGRGVSLRTVLAFDAHEIGRKPVAVPAARPTGSAPLLMLLVGHLGQTRKAMGQAAF